MSLPKWSFGHDSKGQVYSCQTATCALYNKVLRSSEQLHSLTTSGPAVLPYTRHQLITESLLTLGPNTDFHLDSKHFLISVLKVLT